MHRDDQHEPAEYLVTRLKEALAADDRVNQLDIDVRVTSEEVILLGTTQTEDRRQAAEAVARSVLPHHQVVNDLEVKDLAGELKTTPGAAVRVAAVGDIHMGVDSVGSFRPCLEKLGDEADMLVLAGDLTRHGTVEEIKVLVGELEGCPVPIVGVLGNHDHHSDQSDELMRVLTDAGVTMLEGTSTVLDIDGVTVGIAGTKGFGGGFAGACGSEFGERILKDFIGHTRSLSEKLGEQLSSFDTDIRLALLHFSPVADTLRGERLEIYPWLGSYLLAEAIDNAGCDFVFHGHAHAGTENGITAGGIQVRNVAQPVLGQAYKVYCIEPQRVLAGVTAIGEMVS